MNPKNRKRTLAIILRQWLGSRSIVRGIRELSSQSGIREETLVSYFKGRTFPKEENLNRLLAVPGLESISCLVEAPGPQKKVQKGEKKPKRPAQAKGKKQPPIKTEELNTSRSTQERAAEVNRLLESLGRELLFFRKGSSEDRECLREAVSNENAGYLIALLKALLDEDAYQNWLLFAEYPWKGKKDEG